MRLRKSGLGKLFALMLTALLAIPLFYASSQTTWGASGQDASSHTIGASGQDASRSDVKQIPKIRSEPPIFSSAPSVAPSNDNCANAINIASCPFTDTKSTVGATTETGEPAPCGAIASTIWYTLAASANRRSVTVDTCTSSPVDTVLAAYKVTGAACAFAGFVNVACNDDFCGDGFQSTITFTADAGAAYKIQVGGFAGVTGNITTNVACVDILCDDVVINGTLGTGAPAFTGPQVSGNVTGRLNRNGISSTCAAPKSCLIFDPANLRAFDAYSISNQRGQNVCVSVNLAETAGQTCNLQSNAYLGAFNPASICTNYLADPGLSTGVPPTPTNMSFIVPTGQTLVVVVMTTNPGETGCTYTLTVSGNLCYPFDVCLQDESNPSNVFLGTSQTGAYRFCCGGTTFTGSALVTRRGNIVTFQNYAADRRVLVTYDGGVSVGKAALQSPPGTIRCTITDRNTNNNTCVCQ